MKTVKLEKPAEVKSKPERRHDIDWLRVLAMLSIFLFHCARFFDYEDWQVKNNQLDIGMSVFVGFLVQWIIPLFFVLSGLSIYYSLSYRTRGQYVKERFKRLAIPFLFGTFVILIPLQVYIERVSHSQFVGSFIEFYPHYFDGFYAFGGNFAWMGLHLWYLEILFIFSLITLPLFLYLRKEAMHGFILPSTPLPSRQWSA
jgi:glucan biosynthesis protein C